MCRALSVLCHIQDNTEVCDKVFKVPVVHSVVLLIPTEGVLQVRGVVDWGYYPVDRHPCPVSHQNALSIRLLARQTFCLESFDDLLHIPEWKVPHTPLGIKLLYP